MIYIFSIAKKKCNEDFFSWYIHYLFEFGKIKYNK